MSATCKNTDNAEACNYVNGRCLNCGAPQTTGVQVITGFPACRLEEAQEALAKLHAKAVRAASKRADAVVPAMPELVVLRHWQRQLCSMGCGAPIEHGWCTQGHVARSVALVDLKVSAEKPVVGPWELLACVEPMGEHGNTVRRVPGADESIDLTPWYDAARGNRCAHCKTNRKRTETFVLRQTETGELLQIGRNCLEAFLGRSPAAIVARLGFIASIVAIGEDESDGWSRGTPPPASTAEFLGWVAACIRLDGWTSATQARDQGGESTATWAYRVMNASPTDREMYKVQTERLPNATDRDRAEQSLAWCAALPDEEVRQGGDYLHNIRLAARCNHIGKRQHGLVASIVRAYERHLAKLAEARRDIVQPGAVAKKSQHVGQVKERLDLNLTVERVFDASNDWGAATRLVMRDDSGNEFVWFASGQPTVDGRVVQPGMKVTCRGTVKKHGEWKGIASTHLTRCKLELSGN